MGCFYCDEHHEGREAIMFKVGEMKAGVLYLFKDQAHKGRCALALKAHKKELCECTDQERADFAEDLEGQRRHQGAVGLHEAELGLLRRHESPSAFPYRPQV